MFGINQVSDPTQKKEVPTMQKQPIAGTGTATTDKTNNFANIWEEDGNNLKKQQSVKQPEKPVDNNVKPGDKPADNKQPPVE